MGEDPRQGVVDLVGDGGGELPQRGHLLGLDELLLGLAERRGPLLNLALQRAHQVPELRLRLAEGPGHPVEGQGQRSDLVRGPEGDLVLEVALGHPLGPLDELGHRPHHEAAREEAHDRGQRQHRHGGEDERPALEVRDPPVDLGQGETDVHDAEHPLARRVRVAGRGGTALLVVDRGHHPEGPVTVGGGIGPAPGGQRQARDGLVGLVAGVAGLRPLVHQAPDLLAVGREGDLPVLVEDPDPFDALLSPDGRHDPVDFLAPVLEHEVVGAALDRVAEERSAPDHLAGEVVALDPDGHEHEASDGGQGQRGDDHGKPDAQAVPPPDGRVHHAVRLLGPASRSSSPARRTHRARTTIMTVTRGSYFDLTRGLPTRQGHGSMTGQFEPIDPRRPRYDAVVTPRRKASASPSTSTVSVSPSANSCSSSRSASGS